MRRAILLFLFAVGAHAEQPCPKLEYAELDSLPREDLLQMRCEYLKDMLDPKLLQAGQWGQTAGQRCAEEMSRMDRILGRKYQLKSKGWEPTYKEVSAMCRK